MWNPSTKILTIGWYNIISADSSNADGEANFEVQLNFDNKEFKIVHGDHGVEFPDFNGNNVFVGASKDVSCASNGGYDVRR